MRTKHYRVVVDRLRACFKYGKLRYFSVGLSEALLTLMDLLIPYQGVYCSTLVTSTKLSTT